MRLFEKVNTTITNLLHAYHEVMDLLQCRLPSEEIWVSCRIELVFHSRQIRKGREVPVSDQHVKLEYIAVILDWRQGKGRGGEDWENEAKGKEIRRERVLVRNDGLPIMKISIARSFLGERERGDGRGKKRERGRKRERGKRG